MFYARIQNKIDTTYPDTFIPLDGEIILIKTNDGIRMKVGDGSMNFAALGYVDANETIKFIEQTLTDAQKVQARKNIGAISINLEGASVVE